MKESFYLMIAYFVFAILMYYMFWKPDINCQPCLFVLGVIGLIGGIVFMIIFFEVFKHYVD